MSNFKNHNHTEMNDDAHALKHPIEAQKLAPLSHPHPHPLLLYIPCGVANIISTEKFHDQEVCCIARDMSNPTRIQSQFTKPLKNHIQQVAIKSKKPPYTRAPTEKLMHSFFS